MDRLLHDFRYALRTLRRNPGFAAVAVLTLALGIGANTAIFSVVNGVLLRPLPYPEPDEVVQIRQVGEGGGSQLSVSYPNYVDLRDQSRSFEAMGAYGSSTASVTAGGEGIRVGAAWVTSGFFDVLGVEPALGRVFLPEELGVAGPAVAVVGYGYWQSRLGGDRDLSDDVVRIGDRAYAVIGVMPPGFSFPAGTELWLPSDASLANQTRTGHNFRVIGRLRDGVALEQARSDLTAVARRLKARYGDDTRMSDAAVVPLREELVGRARPMLLILLGAAGFLLLIACANVVNLLLARMAARQRELSIRLALGAGARRLAVQFLTEALVLCLAGGVLGMLLAVWGVPALLAFEPGGLPRLDEVGVDWAVLLFALAVALGAAVALGLAPALRATRTDVRGSLADGQRTQTGGASGHRIRRILAASQVALTLVLLVGAGLLARSFLRVLAVDPGFRTKGAVVMDLWLPSPEDEAAKARTGRFYTELLGRLRAIPGVEAAGGVNVFPLTGSGGNGTFIILDSPDQVAGMTSFEQLMREPALMARLDRMFDDPTHTGSAEFRVASQGYFEAMGIPLVRGRLFDERDGPDAPHVAVISESLAEARWPNEDPIGKLIEFGNMDGDLRPFTIIGIVGDVRERSLVAQPEPTFYANSRQRPLKTFRYSVVMRGSIEPAGMIASARRIVRGLNPEVPLRFRTLEQIFSASLSAQRFALLLIGTFGATALLLAVMGIYGVVSYLSTQRTQEVGIRMALGARRESVVRLLVGQGAVLALAGIAVGLLAAFVLTRFLSGMLYDVGTADPMTFAGIAVVLGGVALLASYIPARRASNVDPMVTLRGE
ncbi:MAG TPA: ABC transporter permease [Longimicrobiales bacterium]